MRLDAVGFMTDPDQLNRLIDLCELRVGGGWTADPTADPLPPGHEQFAQAGTGRHGSDEPPTAAEWMNLGNRAAARLMALLSEE